MPYATQQDMLARYGLPRLVQLTDIGEPMTGELSAPVLDSRLADASAEIDGYLAGRMPVPLAPVPAVVTVLCCRLAYYLLLGATATEIDQADAKAVRAYLMAVAEGKVALLPPAAAPAMAGDGAVLFEPGAKDWGRESS